MSDHGNRRTATRWVPSQAKVQKLLARLPKMFATAPLNVQEASERVANSMHSNKTPDTEDLAMLLLWTIERRGRRKAPKKKLSPSPPPRSPDDPSDIPDTMFARRLREADEENRENPIGKTLRRRLGAQQNRRSPGRKIIIEGDR